MEVYTKALLKARDNLVSYIRKHNLDPSLDLTQDPVHGDKIKSLVMKLNKERDVEHSIYPERDIRGRKKLLKLKKMAKAKKEAEKAAKKEKKVKEAIKEVKKEEAKAEKAPKKGRAAAKYDYPLVDGKEMTSEQKKKYRMEQRKLAAGKTPKPEKKEKVEKKSKKEAPVKEEKVSKKVKKTVKVKKSKKEED